MSRPSKNGRTNPNTSTSPKKSKFESIEIIPHLSNYGNQRSSVKHMSFGENECDETTTDSGMNDSGIILNRVLTESRIEDTELEEIETAKESNQVKFGTFDGVLGRCLLCMWGVIMFLRTGWIVAHAGIFQATLVMLVSASVTFLTTLSLCAIVTNGMVQGGGPYFFISRSLGPQWGGPVGILFAFANCVGVSLHLAGFAEAVKSLYFDPINGKTSWAMTPNAAYDIQIIGAISLLFLVSIAYRGVGSIIKFNLVLLFVMFVSIIAFAIGTFTTKPDTKSLGFTGYKKSTFKSNWGPLYKNGENFLTMISIFFPSVTGCMAGANISGDLRNPEKNIPNGTISAVIFSMLIYIVLAWMLGASCLRVSDNGTGGLYNDYLIMSNISVYKLLVDLGIFASTFSSATSCFVAAPRILQKVCADGLFPKFKYFSKGRDRDNEPLRCYLLVVVVSLAFLSTGNINFVAPLVTNFFMVTYALVNYSVYTWEVAKVPGWRPSFQFYNKWVCLFAAIQCVVLMFLISWPVALITFITSYAIYKYVGTVNLKISWGTTNEAMVYKKTCENVIKYQSIQRHAKIIRPTFLILNINKFQTVKLYQISKILNYSQGLTMIGDILFGKFSEYKTIQNYRKRVKEHRKILFTSKKSENFINEAMNKECVIETVIAENMRDGFRNLFQLAGMGGLKPNVCMFTIPYDKIDEKDLDNINSLNYYKSDEDKDFNENKDGDKENQNEDQKISEIDINDEKYAPMWYNSMKDCLLTGSGVLLNVDKKSCTLNLLDTRKPNTYIDVWWIYDDGGMTLLLSFLLTKNKIFENCHLRIMSLESMDLNDKVQLISLLNKLRIKAEIKVIGSKGDIMETINVKQVQNMNKKKNDIENKSAFNGSNDALVNFGFVDEKEIPNQIEVYGQIVQLSDFTKKRCRKYWTISDLISKQSKNQCELIFITMPYPREEYKWFEYETIIKLFIKKIDAPLLFVRGNQDQVLITDF